MCKEKIEAEFKLLLTKQQFNSILKSYPFTKTVQKNYYYTNSYFTKQKIAIRIREVDNQKIFTVKRMFGDQIYELELENVQGIDDLKVQVIIQAYNLEPLKLLTTFTTVRYSHYLVDSVLVLDENYFGDVIDYELELESFTEHLALDSFHQILKKFKLQYQKNAENKLTRSLSYQQA